MQYDVELADPLVDVRDVVETFRSCGVTAPNWHGTLADAVAALDRLPQAAQVDARLPHLIPRLRLLLAHGLLERTRIPGIPRPEDDDWGFDEATAS